MSLSALDSRGNQRLETLANNSESQCVVMNGPKVPESHTQDYRSDPPQFGVSETLPIQRTLSSGIKLKDRYLIERQLGQGGCGAAYLARDEELHSKRVVIKVLLEAVVEDKWFKKKFQQEKEALARIDHPGVVGVLDAGITPDGKQFLVMQYVEGQTLASLLQHEGMELEQVARIVQQLGKALTAAHKEGIIHCDLKPENVIVQRAGEEDELAKIIDFGVAKVKDSQVRGSNEPTRVAGTLYYFAPEQIEGRPTSSSDIYSMGVLAFVMVTGRKPFNPRAGPLHLAAQDLMGLQRSGPRFKPKELRPELPKAAERAILKALSFNPADRYPEARDFGNELAHALTEVDVETEVEPRGQSKTSDQGPVLEIAHVLFLDIVAYSTKLMQQQAQATRQLREVVQAAPQFQCAQKEKKVISLPTGDGMALVFFGDPASAVRCAQEISLALKGQIDVRMGIHTGPVYHVTDINDQFNIVGGGINVAQRVMDCGDAGHILVSKATADVLKQLDGCCDLIHELGEYEVKHGERIQLYNLYNSEVGNPLAPAKLKKDAPRRDRLAISVVASVGILIIALVVVFGVARFRKPSPSENGTATQSATSVTDQPASLGSAKSDGSAAVNNLSLKLSLEAQKWPSGSVIPLFDKIDSTGEIKFRFEKGDGFRLRIVATHPGYLYLFNDASGPDILVLFPSPALNNGSGFLAANQQFSFPPSDWLISKSTGYEKFWVVWSTQPVGELEDLIRSAKSVRQILTDPGQMARARNFLANQSGTKPRTELDSEEKRLNINVQNDTVVLGLWKR